jgi:lactate permease
VLRVPPVAPNLPEAAIVDWNLLSLPGTAIFIGTILASIFLGSLGSEDCRTLRADLPRADSLAGGDQPHGRTGLCDRLFGMDTVMGLSLTRTGVLYPFFGTMLGWLGVALTGTGRRIERALRQPAEGDS